MRARHVVPVGLIVAAALTATPLRAQFPAWRLDPETRLSQFLASGQQGLAAFLQVARRDFRDADQNMDGVVNAEDARLRAESWQRTMLSQQLAELMRNDLDLDGVITYEEVVRAQELRIRRSAYLAPGSDNNPQQRIDVAVEAIMRADRNGDGRIDLAEMLAFVRAKPPIPDTEGTAQHAIMMIMDADGDGSVTPAEFDQVAERVFRAVDADGDGVLSKDEIDRFRVRKSAEFQAQTTQAAQERARLRVEARVAACAMPKPSDAARVILLRAQSGVALSTVTLMSQDVPVETSPIVIEPGDEPLYLIVRGWNAVIWRLSGAVDRVERLVLAGGATAPNRSVAGEPPIVGVTGIAADKVTFLRHPDCIPDFSDAPSEAVAVVRGTIGRDPVAMAVRGEVAGVSVPSGRTIERDRAPDEFIVRGAGDTLRVEHGARLASPSGDDLQHRLRSFHSEGIVEIDPAAVVASHAVERYTVLPEEAGLLQLAQSGVLVETPANDRAAPRQFSVRAATRYPGGLNGAHRVRFVIAPGVPAPDGDPGHSCVVRDGGRVVANAAACQVPDRR